MALVWGSVPLKESRLPEPLAAAPEEKHDQQHHQDNPESAAGAEGVVPVISAPSAEDQEHKDQDKEHTI